MKVSNSQVRPSFWQRKKLSCRKISSNITNMLILQLFNISYTLIRTSHFYHFLYDLMANSTFPDAEALAKKYDVTLPFWKLKKKKKKTFFYQEIFVEIWQKIFLPGLSVEYKCEPIKTTLTIFSLFCTISF